MKMHNSMKLLPISLDSLKLAEKNKFYNWITDLRELDQDNALLFIEKTEKFFREYQQSDRNSFFVLNAVGSTVYKKPEYDDLDFLLITNSSLPDFKGAINDNYGQALSPEYDVTSALTHLENYYDNPANLPGRNVQNIIPSEGMGHPWTKIHNILQRNVPSEKMWNERDVYLRVPIFRLPMIEGK